LTTPTQPVVEETKE